MTPSQAFQIFCGWLAWASLWAFGLFGIDKWRAKHDQAHRIRQSSLLLVSALGGWPGGLLAILVFRHKSAKASFLLQFFAAFIAFVSLSFGALKLMGKI